ncbi:MAG: hypothetical protein V7717_06665 [Porticoccaceae bacterium]
MTKATGNSADRDKQESITPPHSIKAAAIALTSQTSASPGSSSRTSFAPSKPHAGVWVALAICLLLVLVVIFVLPNFIANKNQTTAPLPEQALTPTPPVPADTDQQDLQARRQAQDVLAGIKELQKLLENKSVRAWAASEYNAALAKLPQGDFDYRQRRYAAALVVYSSVETDLKALAAQVEPRLKQLLSDAQAALEIGNAERALELFQLALTIEADNSVAKKGLARAQVLPEVMAHVAEGEQQLKTGAAEAALIAFNKALALDGEHPLPRSGQKRAQQHIDNARYQSAMSEGFKQLNAGRYQDAITAFKQALAVTPQSTDARSALAQAQARQTHTGIERLLSQARASEAQENWQDAVNSYRLALERDSTVSESRVGEIRASTRAELDQNLDIMLVDPLRLASNSIYRQAEQLLSDARGIGNPGPRLIRQIDNLQQTLSAARIPVALTLQSDNATQVTLLKVGEFGTFQNKVIKLVPGRYVATGYRQGYRDVRIAFKVTSAAEADSLVVQVQCDESI